MSVLSGGSLEPTVKKIPLSLTLGKLRVLVKQLFNVDASVQQLSIQLDKNAPPVLLEDEEASLRFFGVIDGTDLYINSVDG